MPTKSPLFARNNPGGPFVFTDETATTGNIYFVHSGTGSDSNTGENPNDPLATIDAAINKCTANQGDRIYVMPGHAETVSGAAGIDADVAGIAIIGLGEGADRPTLTLSAVASTVEIGAASVRLENLVLQATADTTIMLDINGADAVVKGCEFRSTSGKEFVTAIDINGGSANACDRTRIVGCTITSALAAGASQGIELGEVADKVLIEGCDIVGDFANACIHNPTGKVLTNLRVSECVLDNQQTGDHSIELVSACTGVLSRNLYKNDMTQATGCDPGSCFSFECYHCDAINVSGILCPVAT